jgi:aminopeptidase-like protein/aminoglycoside N3'-acetyltransferase
VITRPMPPALVPAPAAALPALDELRDALDTLGVREGDVLLVHADLDALRTATGHERAPADAWHAAVLGALRDAVGEAGTVLVPTYTFSFCRGESFETEATPTSGGPWSPCADFLEYARTRRGAVRSPDPIHSVAGLGPRVAELLLDAEPTCFGPGSVFRRLVEADAVVCLIGLPLEEATVRLCAEEEAAVPFRYRKLFTGVMRERGAERQRGWLSHVRLLAEEAALDCARLERMARADGVCRAARAAGVEVLAVRARAYHEYVLRALRADPWLTARGPAGDPVALEERRVRAVPGALPPEVPTLPADASMRAMLDALWRLPRHLVSDGYDAALAALATQLPMTVHEFASGSECWGWVVPEKWTCHEATLETLDGRRVLSAEHHPLHVVSYSLPYDAVVTRDELRAHLHTHPRLDDAVPFVFKYYERDWGLCCTRRQAEALTDPAYRVRIRTSASYGTLKVGEVVARGASDDTVVLCAHVCHPAMANDDLAGVVVAVDVMRVLLRRAREGTLHHTYRLLLVPETIGSVAWLSRHETLIPRLRAGLFLEMLGLDAPHALQRSFAGDTQADACFEVALRAADPGAWVGPFRGVIGNDERQFNAPGVRVPMLSLSRVLPPSHPDWPYPEYHSSRDTAALVSDARLAESRDAVLHMLDALERNVVPVNRYRGEPFCSRHGLHVDAFADPAAHRALFDVIFLVDGTRTVADIARACDAPFDAVWTVLSALAERGLVSW